MSRLLPALVLRTALLAPAPYAEAQAPPATTQGAAELPAEAKAKKVRKPRSERSPESVACSAEANQKSLKGNDRKKFRRACMATARKKA